MQGLIYRQGKDIAEQYKSVRNWLLGVSEGSRHNYKVYMRKFISFSQLDPDQLLELARTDRHAVHNKLKEFWEKLREEGLASKTRSVAYTSIRSFLSWNDLPLGKSPRPFVGKVQYESYRVLEPHELSMMLHVARTGRDKALVSFLAQSGQRVGILAALRYRHVQNELERGLNPIIVDVSSELLGKEGFNVNKGGVVYRFAIGKECARFLRMSIEYRRDAGEPIDGDSWLFRSFSRFVGYAPDGRPLCVRVKDNEPSPPLSTGAIRFRVVTVAKRAGLDRVRPGPRMHGSRTLTHEIHPHIFRRWWKFRMRKGGVTDSDLLAYMMGHRNVRMSHGGAYDEFDPDYIRREYAKGEPFLTVTTNPVSYGAESPLEPKIPRPPSPSIAVGGGTVNRSRGSQCVVNEWELDAYLSSGWGYVAILPSGRIIVEG